MHMCRNNFNKTKIKWIGSLEAIVLKKMDKLV